VNALANPEVGKYLNEHYCSSFQKVATFRIVNGQKQGGNVAAYFCAPDGRVLHCVAGPVDAGTMLREAKWVVETAKKAIEEADGDGAKFKTYFRKAHAERLRKEHGLVVEAVTFDEPEAQDPKGALTYRDPSGQPLAPKLPPPPIVGLDVKFRAQAEVALKDELKANRELDATLAAAPGVVDKRGRAVALGTQGRVHQIMAAHSMANIEKVYGTVFENILGEQISDKPVQVATPFPWHGRKRGGIEPAVIDELGGKKIRR
jgi:hypothetical protein